MLLAFGADVLLVVTTLSIDNDISCLLMQPNTFYVPS